jgi:serine protease Do
LVQLPSDDPIPVVWRSVRLSPQMPTLYQVFEDAGAFAAVDRGQTGSAAITQDDHYTGGASLKVTPDGAFRLPLAPAVAIRENPTWGQYRYVRFAFRKYGSGRVGLELTHDRSADRPVRYDAGIGNPVQERAVRVWLQPLPAEWIVITRDLFAEFGNLDVTGLTITVPDGEYALVDHVYLGRSPGDLDAIPAAPSATVTNDNAMRELARPVIDKAAASMVALQFNDGRVGTGVLISGDGDILTAGHNLSGSDEDVIVHLPDGRALKGVIRGIFREADMGLVRVDAGGALPFLELNPVEELPTEDFYVAMAHRGEIPREGPAEPQSEVVGLRRSFLTMLWVEVGINDWSAGGPLLDKQGRLVGIHNRQSKYGGFLYSRLGQLHSLLPRMREGQRWGSWYPGTGPVLGIDITPIRKGCQVDGVAAGGPGENAGLVPGDVITRVEGKSVVSLQDIDSIIADYDPGREIELQLARGEETLKLKLTLGPRFP